MPKLWPCACGWEIGGRRPGGFADFRVALDEGGWRRCSTSAGVSASEPSRATGAGWIAGPDVKTLTPLPDLRPEILHDGNRRWPSVRDNLCRLARLRVPHAVRARFFPRLKKTFQCRISFSNGRFTGHNESPTTQTRIWAKTIGKNFTCPAQWYNIFNAGVREITRGSPSGRQFRLTSGWDPTARDLLRLPTVPAGQ